MCLPVPCLKVIVFIGSICSIAISVALLARNSLPTQSPSMSKSRRNPSSAAPASPQSRPLSSASMYPRLSFCFLEWQALPVLSSPPARRRAREHVCWLSFLSVFSSSLSSSWEQQSSSLLALRPSSVLTALMAQKLTSLPISIQQVKRPTRSSANSLVHVRSRIPPQNFMAF